MVASATAESEAFGVFEADAIWDLALEWEDVFLCALGAARGRRNGIFFGVQTETFGKSDGVGAVDGCAETFDGWEDLFVEIPFCIWLEARGRVYDFLPVISAFCSRVDERWGGRSRVRGSGDNERHHVVDADGIAVGHFAQGDLDLRHAIGIGVFLRVLAEFLMR